MSPRSCSLLVPSLAAALLFGSGRWAASDPPAAGSTEVELRKLTYPEMQKELASRPDSKLIVVDAWATWCGPCKENFPHLVEMHAKYADKGLSVVSLSMDDPEDTKAHAEAVKFLKEQKAVFTNILLNETPEVAFDSMKITAVPAVFLFGPDGKEVKRFTMEDPDNQFTYEQVEAEIRTRLGIK